MTNNQKSDNTTEYNNQGVPNNIFQLKMIKVVMFILIYFPDYHNR